MIDQARSCTSAVGVRTPSRSNKNAVNRSHWIGPGTVSECTASPPGSRPGSAAGPGLGEPVEDRACRAFEQSRADVVGQVQPVQLGERLAMADGREVGAEQHLAPTAMADELHQLG